MMKVQMIESELNSCVAIFELLGLQYFRLKNLTPENFNHKPSFARTSYVLVIIAVLSVFLLFYIKTDKTATPDKLTAKSAMLYAVHHSMNFSLMCVVWTNIIQSYRTTFTVKRIYLNIRKLSLILAQEFNMLINFKLIKKLVWRRLAIILIFFATCHCTTAYTKYETLEKFIQMNVGAFPVLFLLMTVYKFVFYVDMINKQLLLCEMILKKLFVTQPITIIDDVHLRVTPVKPFRYNDVTRKIIATRKIYNIIAANAKMINQSFGACNLALIASLVVTLTAAGYQMFVVIIGGLSMAHLAGKLNNI